MVCEKKEEEKKKKEKILPDLYGFIWIQFQINHFCFSEKYANFIHRQGATDCKVHGSDFKGEKYHRRLI